MSQQCSSCSSDCPDGAKFCIECGSPLARACPSCGHPAIGKFCAECGTPLTAAAPVAAAPPPPDLAPVSERRTTSVLFGDLVSFTTLSESRDPEEVRELLSSYFAVARTVVGRYGGTIEKFIGDAVMAVWGVPLAHEDDAERAVRAGLDLVSEVAALGESIGAPGLAMRVGVVTGSVAVTLGAVHEGMVAGDAVNTAARVQSAAQPGTVWVDAETRGLTAAAVAYSDMGEHELKGKAEPARLYRADTIVAARGGAQRVDGLEAPMVGRDAEFRRVKDLFHAIEGDKRSRLLLVEGLAGTGKSRLGWEFEKYVDGVTSVVRWHRGRCLSYGDGVAFWAFAEMVRSRLGLLENDDRAQVQAKVSAGVRALAADAGEGGWLEPRVAALLTGTTGFERTDLFAAWAVFLERVADDKPVVLLFEDVQHADASLLDLVDYLLETCRASLLVVLLARPELRQARPSIVGSARSTLIDLQPLDPQHMAELVDGLVHDLPRRAREALVSRAEGVPLYAVETVRSLIDRDAVLARDGRYVFDDPDGTKVDLEQLAAPTSLQTLIAARLDALSPLERRTIQDASVLGVSFRMAGLVALSDSTGFELEDALLGLVRKGVIEAVPDPRSPEIGGYRFLQALVREVAYSTLARKDRRSRHLAAADHLERDGEIAADTIAGVIAQHLLDALEATPPNEPERPALAARARALLTNAAERAEALGSPGEALRSSLAALGLDPEPREAAELELRAARVAQIAGLSAQAEELGRHARQAFLELGERLLAAECSAVIGQALGELGRQGEALAMLVPELEEVAQLPDSLRTQHRLIRPLHMSSRMTGDRVKQIEISLRDLQVAELLGDAEAIASALNGMAITLIDSGSPTAYLTLLQRAIELSREHHLTDRLGRSLANVIGGVYMNDLPAAAKLAVETLDVARRLGDWQNLTLAMVNTGYGRWLQGDWDVLVSEADDLLAHAGGSFTGTVELLRLIVLEARGQALVPREFGATDDPLEQMARTMVSGMGHLPDDPAAAARAAATAMRGGYGDGLIMDDFEVFVGPAVELQLRAGAVDEAEALLDLGAALTGGRASRLLRCQRLRLNGLIAIARGDDPEELLRSAERELEAYGAVYYLARTRLALGRWLRTHGRHDEAEPMLAEARATFLELGAAPSLAELERVGVSA